MFFAVYGYGPTMPELADVVMVEGVVSADGKVSSVTVNDQELRCTGLPPNKKLLVTVQVQTVDGTFSHDQIVTMSAPRRYPFFEVAVHGDAERIITQRGAVFVAGNCGTVQTTSAPITVRGAAAAASRGEAVSGKRRREDYVFSESEDERSEALARRYTINLERGRRRKRRHETKV